MISQKYKNRLFAKQTLRHLKKFYSQKTRKHVCANKTRNQVYESINTS